jgi:hypothetical protein
MSAIAANPPAMSHGPLMANPAADSDLRRVLAHDAIEPTVMASAQRAASAGLRNFNW